METVHSESETTHYLSEGSQGITNKTEITTINNNNNDMIRSEEETEYRELAGVVMIPHIISVTVRSVIILDLRTTTTITTGEFVFKTEGSREISAAHFKIGYHLKHKTKSHCSQALSAVQMRTTTIGTLILRLLST